MVKADYKRDYYADLDLPNTADELTIRKRFRELAKQYHPDRNPGREVDVVPKFQAIQAAHEILGDPNQKPKYDAERLKLLNKARETTESPAFRKQPPPRRTDSGFPNGGFPQPGPQPPPRRDQSTNRYAPQQGARTRPQSATADKFTQFARDAPSRQWDRARFNEEASARADALRGMNAMRPGLMPQTSPLRSRPHPTAPRSAGADPYSSGNEPSPGFPGLGRTTSSQRQGFNPYGKGADEPQTRSAYAQYRSSERDRPPSAGPFPKDPQAQQEPTETLRPGLRRTSSKYATSGGERTTLNTANIGRSASVRNSPIGSDWEERGPFGNRSAEESRHPRPRHRSHSPPKARAGGPRFEFSETSSDEDSSLRPEERPKAQPRRPQAHYAHSGEGTGLTGCFPNTNYNRTVHENNSYQYPAPETKGNPSRRPFENATSSTDGHGPDVKDPAFRTRSMGDVPNAHAQNGQDPGKENSRFSAEDWHETLDSHADMFNLNPSNQDRKSPTKGTRTARAQTARSYAPTKDNSKAGVNRGFDPNIAAGVRHVNAGVTQEKASAFQSGRLPPNFAEKVNGGRRGSNAVPMDEATPAEPHVEAGYFNGHGKTPDEMDVDSPLPPETEPSESSEEAYNVTVEEERSPKSTYAPPQQQQQQRRNRENDTNGFNLHDLKQSTPFAPSDTGLKDLNDLSTNLPFQSRPSEAIDALHRTNSSTLRDLNLPRPPVTPQCPPDDKINQSTWSQYGSAMQTYMHDWNKFNNAMILHFQSRQEAVTQGMYRNWVFAYGDGASAEDYEASGGTDRAGYATYMTWLDDDKKCKVWWDVAFEEHRRCMEGLGKVRKRIKQLNTSISK